MKTTTIFYILLIVLVGCTNYKYEKPFIIIDKQPMYEKAVFNTYYKYQDKYGNKTYFYDSSYKYNIGDTIK